MIFMIIESIIGVVVVATLAYLYWKSIEGEMKEGLPKAEIKEPVVRPEVKVELDIAAKKAVEVESPVTKPKRARNKGKFVGDDKSTPEVNEAWEGGKAPAKQAKPKTAKTTKPKVAETSETAAKKPRPRKPKMTVLKK
jgi:hypothetical protein